MTDQSLDQHAIASYLNIPREGWSILDKRDSLVLLHYNEDSLNDSKLNHIRGLVLDINDSNISTICNSFMHTPILLSNKINRYPNNLLLTKNRERIQTDGLKTVMNRGLDGVVVRLFKWKGNVYFSTFKKLYNLTTEDSKNFKSRWGSSQTFIQMWENLGGPTDELFEDSDNYCYTFIIVHPELMVGSLENVGNGKIVHIDTSLLPGSSSLSGSSSRTRKAIVFPHQFKSCMIGDNPPINLDEANDFLSKGWGSVSIRDFKDHRLSNGEFVIISQYSNGQLRSMYRVHSDGYQWRVNLRNGDQNIKHRLYCLLSDSYMDTNNNVFYRKFNGKYPIKAGTDLSTAESRYKYIISLFYDSLNVANKEKMGDPDKFFDQFIVDRKQCIDDLWNLFKSLKNIEDGNDTGMKKFPGLPPPRVLHIFDNVTKVSDNSGYDELYDIIMRELGHSLYKIMKYTKSLTLVEGIDNLTI